jgi:WhiB family transcriptional regulator, redox-sensing transcriptional regulator
MGSPVVDLGRVGSQLRGVRIRGVEERTVIDIFVGHEPWMELGECRSHPPDHMFPENSTEVARALDICALCPVRTTCLQWALDNDERYGTWGGVSEAGLNRLRKGTPTACERNHAGIPSEKHQRKDGRGSSYMACRVCERVLAARRRNGEAA